MERKYYDAELKIDGTAMELFKEVRNGYRDAEIPAMQAISEFLNGEGRIHEKRFVDANIKWCEEKSTKGRDFYAFLMDIERMKSGDDVISTTVTLNEIEEYSTNESGVERYDTTNGSYDKVEDRIYLTVVESEGDITRTNGSSYSYDEVKDWTVKDFERAVNEMLFYANEIEHDDIFEER